MLPRTVSQLARVVMRLPTIACLVGYLLGTRGVIEEIRPSAGGARSGILHCHCEVAKQVCEFVGSCWWRYVEMRAFCLDSLERYEGTRIAGN